MSKILQGLNNKQIEAVKTTRGPVEILAGAGSGKTRVLTRRIAYLIQHDHVKPWNNLALTFTNRAAKEMKSRIAKLLHSNIKGLRASTFHSFGFSALRYNATRLGYSSNFTVADSSKQGTALKHVLKAQHISNSQYTRKDAMTYISSQKNFVQLPKSKHYLDNHKYTDPKNFLGDLVYYHYQRYLKRNQLMDFDDLIMLTDILFKRCPDVLHYYQNHYQYVSVDEYQDTDYAQYLMIRMVAAKYHNICVVGDPDQSIYSWRGANVKYILDFDKIYPDAHVIHMAQNYRSTSNIVNAAYSVIRHNPNSKRSELWTKAPHGRKLRYYRARNPDEEAKFVRRTIKSLMFKHHNLKYSDFAILYRMNAQSRPLEHEFNKVGIPYAIIGNINFLQRAEIITALSYLAYIYNPDDSISFDRIVNRPRRGLGAKSLQHLHNFADYFGDNINDAAIHCHIDPKMPKHAARKFKQFGLMMGKLRKKAHHTSLEKLYMSALTDSGYIPTLKKHAISNPSNTDRLEDLDELRTMIVQYTKAHPEYKAKPFNMLNHFLMHITLLSSVNTEKKGPKVTLMTLHASKGLEYPVVFIIGMEDNVFPMGMTKDDPSEYHEERRLAYVGITRAERRLYLTGTVFRMFEGRTVSNDKSPFYLEIDPKYVHVIHGR